MTNDSLKVICITKNSTKLIKGATYSAISIHSYTHGKISDRTIYLKNVGNYSIKNFTLLDGSSLDSIADFNIERTKGVDTNFTNYTGQFVKCRYSSGKSLKEGEIYYIEEQRKTERKGYNGKIYYDFKFKIRGIRNCVSPYRFETIPIAEQRNIKLKNLKGEKIKTGEQTRKFLLYTEKQKNCILFKILSQVLLDIDNVEIDSKINISELMLTKGNKNYAIIKEDIELFLKCDISKLLSSYQI